MKPSLDDIHNLRTFLNSFNKREKIDNNLFKSLMNSKHIPKYIKQHVNMYNQIGGENNECCQIWPNKIDKCNPCQLPSQTIGSGAYGTVYAEKNDDIVIKVFTPGDLELIEYLKSRLTIVFNIIQNYNVYTELLLIDGHLAYKMNKLEILPFKRLPFEKNIKMFNMFINVILNEIDKIHSYGILHCDLKFDNIMFSNTGCTNDIYKNIMALFNCLKTNTKIIDFDGCILIHNDNIHAELLKGYIYHPTTPAFAHPYLLEKLYTLKHTATIERYAYIEMFRRTYANIESLNHLKYHCLIFEIDENLIDKSYNEIFPYEITDYHRLINILKFCDYYNMMMSILLKIHNRYNDNDIIRFEEEIFMFLRKIRDKLDIQQLQGGGKKKIKGGNVQCTKKPTITKLSKGEYCEFGIGGKLIIKKQNKEEIQNPYDITSFIN